MILVIGIFIDVGHGCKNEVDGHHERDYGDVEFEVVVPVYLLEG